MLFNSFEFIFFFLPIAFTGYFLLNSKGYVVLAKFYLVAASLFFYSWWHVIYLPLILLSMAFNFWAASKLKPDSENSKASKSFLAVAVTVNLVLLGYFKYSDFFIENLNFVFDSDINLLNLALPLAISFFTFQQIAYLVDSYRGETKKEGFLNYAVFVSFFPQLIAGPIVHHKEMMPQFSDANNRSINYENIAKGLFIFSIGLFKKVVIADSFAVWATAGFDQASQLYFFEAWATSLSYTFQLYFDFSGYTDMAIGIALMFNIILPLNFNSPYQAINIQDFWRRWHITLSRFLKDYVYIPLGGNRQGPLRTYSNLMATFIIGGIWHGAGWTFVFWGFLHGFALCVHRLWSRLGLRCWTWLGWLITFNFVNMAWIFFRAENWSDAIKVLKGMLGLHDKEKFEFSIDFVDALSRWVNVPLYDILPHAYRVVNVQEQSLVYCLLLIPFVLWLKNNNRFIQNQAVSLRMMVLAALAFSYATIHSFLSTTEVFLYFNF